MLASALAAFAGFVYSVRAQTINREADAALQLRAQQLLRDIGPSLLELDVAGALSEDRRFASQPFLVRERSGGVLFRSPAFPTLSAGAEGDGARAARTATELVLLDDRTRMPIRVATVVTERPGARALAIQLAASTQATQQALRQWAMALAFWFVVVLAAASYGGSFIARRALRPVEAINARVRAIQSTSLADRLDVRTGSKELDGLVETLNAMLDRIEMSMHGAQRFAADASHELQTPIAAMRMVVDLCARDGQGLSGSCAMAAALAADVDRLSALVRDLRLLALADAGHLIERPEHVEVTLLVHECCDIVRALAEPQRIAVSVDVLSDVVVDGSAVHLRRAILNIAQNAVRYSPDGATVQITVGRLDHEAVIAIADDGCGIGPEDLSHIFERFYRADPARARDTGGTGLGLAIADQIVRSHGGRIDVTSALGAGSTFLIALPIAYALDRPIDPRSDETVNGVSPDFHRSFIFDAHLKG